uniref:TEP1-F n=1 Tax=Scolopendra japonica TaxID=2609777 RepID=A0A0E4B906_9MYRI|nr:thioester-containing protein 3 [Scolopendra japonica]
MTFNYRIFIGLIFFVFIFQNVLAIGHYMIVAPKILRPALNYHVSVSVHNVTQPVRIDITIGGISDSGVLVSLPQQVFLESEKSQVVNFQIGMWGMGKYSMKAIGSGGLQFANETDLSYELKSYLVFIQTDKAIYKPGQPVRIRVIVVSPSLRPAGTEPLDMYITDGQGNRIKQWKRAFTSRGVFNAEMQLSNEPVLGDWNITVLIQDQVYKKSFTVAEYVLPSFEVRVDLPPFVTFNASDMVATVRAKYTYGKPVKGKVVLMVTPLVRSPKIRTYYTDPLRRTAEIDGKVDIHFNLFSDLNLKDDYHRMIRFEAIVTEAVTERRENATNTMGIFKYKHKVELVKLSETFKPGLKFSVIFKVATQDDIPVMDEINPLIIRYGYTYEESIYDRLELKIPKNGTVPLDLYPPFADNVNQIIIIAEYKDVKQQFPPIRRAESPSNTYIQAVLTTLQPKANEEVIITVNSTVRLNTFNVVVMGRGDIVFAETVNAGGERSIKVKFFITRAMAPNIRFIVYYTDLSGEVVADGISFEVEGVFQNYVNIESNSKDVKPKDTVNLQISTNPNSFVGLLGIDQSVLILKTGNDISQQEILYQLDEFDPGKQPYSKEDLYYNSVWFPGSATASEVFKEAGFITLSNAMIYSIFPYLMYRSFAETVDQTSDISLLNVDESINANLRMHFPETWLWENLTAGPDGKAVITREVPDTITSWMITAFSVDMITGLAVTESPTKITVFRPFFVSMNLPYSVIRGEAIAVQAIVFNYMKQTVSVTVTLENTHQFDFVTVEDEINEVFNANLKSKRIAVKSGEPESVYFMIIPKELGFIDIKITAETERAGDAMLKKLLVKPEGIQQKFNKAFLVDLQTPSVFNAYVNVDIPKHVVSGSEKIEISAIADVMGPTINNFDDLLQMPFGCGEQNMMRFVPNIVVLEYLSNTEQLTDSLRSKAILNMETGYQRELVYKRDDGSFSAFGSRDENGSTWLTAFVVKSFGQALPYITIDEKVIENSLKWLALQQAENGSFPEVGSINNKEIQGGSSDGIALTAYVLLAFFQNKGETSHGPVVMKALQLLEKELEALTDLYSIVITTYALHVASSNFKEVAYQKLQAAATVKGDLRYWQKPEPTAAGEIEVKSVDVEMTSYALMTYILQNDLSEAMQILKWLISERNSNGGFKSTQDTMIAIQALAKLAQRISDPQVKITVTFTYSGQQKTFSLNRENAMILQTDEIPAVEKNVNISATGYGFGIVQVSYQYNIMVSKEFPAFQVNPLVDRSSTKNRLQLNVCAAYGEKNGVSNMAVMEVTLPSGYVIDRDSLPALHRVDEVKRVDVKDMDTGIIIYFDKLDNKLVCPTIKAYRTFRVAKQRQTAVYLYDYYDQGKAARYFYQTPQASLCDICEGEECNSSKCRKEIEISKESNSNNGCSKASMQIWTLLTKMILIYYYCH